MGSQVERVDTRGALVTVGGSLAWAAKWNEWTQEELSLQLAGHLRGQPSGMSGHEELLLQLAGHLRGQALLE